MRLLLVDREFPPNQHGGIGTYNLALARGLGRKGHFVAVLSCTTDGTLAVSDEPYGVLVRIPHRPPQGTLPRYMRWFDGLVLGQRLVPHAVRLIEHFALDLVEIPSAGGYGYFLAQNMGHRIPVVTRFHGAQGKVPVDETAGDALRTELARLGYGHWRGVLAGALNLPLWRLERGQIQFSHRVTCPSAFSREWLGRAISPRRRRLEVIRNGIWRNASRRRDGAEGPPPAITFVGRCSVSKGVTVLARAVPHILSKAPGATIVFVGPLVDPRAAKILLALADRYPGRVHLKGRLPHDQVLDLLERSYALVAPSFYEICPIAVLEAMSLGIPAVAANAGPMPEIVKDGLTGLLFGVGDAEALTRSVLSLLNSPGKRLAMAEACRSRFAALYDMQIVIGQLEACYDSLLRPRE